MINEAETMKNKEIARKFYELIAAKNTMKLQNYAPMISYIIRR